MAAPWTRTGTSSCTDLPPSILEAVVDDIWRHAGAAPDDPGTWYQPAIIRPRPGIVEMYHYQPMWDVQQHPAIYGTFRDLHRTDESRIHRPGRVQVTGPPDQPRYDQPGFIHWDTDINMYPDVPFRLQGVLALEDTSADMGRFQCVPSIYRDQQRFLDERSKAGPVPCPDIGDHPIVKVPLAAGDLVIWKTTLLHGNSEKLLAAPSRSPDTWPSRPAAPARRAARSGAANPRGAWST